MYDIFSSIILSHGQWKNKLTKRSDNILGTHFLHAVTVICKAITGTYFIFQLVYDLININFLFYFYLFLLYYFSTQRRIICRIALFVWTERNLFCNILRHERHAINMIFQEYFNLISSNRRFEWIIHIYEK